MRGLDVLLDVDDADFIFDCLPVLSVMQTENIELQHHEYL